MKKFELNWIWINQNYKSFYIPIIKISLKAKILNGWTKEPHVTPEPHASDLWLIELCAAGVRTLTLVAHFSEVFISVGLIPGKKNKKICKKCVCKKNKTVTLHFKVTNNKQQSCYALPMQPHVQTKACKLIKRWRRIPTVWKIREQ